MGVSGRSRGRGETQHIASLASDNTATYCVSAPLRAGGRKADPEHAFFGSQEKRRRICADNAILMINIEHNRIIAYLASIIKNICIIFSKRTRLLYPM